MPKTNVPVKSIHSFRLSRECVRQLKTMAMQMGRSESDVVEVALDRMYREETRYNRGLREAAGDYLVEREEKQNETDSDGDRRID